MLRLWKLAYAGHEKAGNVSKKDLLAVVKKALFKGGLFEMKQGKAVVTQQDVETSMLLLKGEWVFTHTKDGLRADWGKVNEMLGATGKTAASLDAPTVGEDGKDGPSLLEQTKNPEAEDPAEAAMFTEDRHAAEAAAQAKAEREEARLRRAIEAAEAVASGRGEAGAAALAYVVACYRNERVSRSGVAKRFGVTVEALRYAEDKYVRPAFEVALG
jgi:hypothetical protein